MVLNCTQMVQILVNSDKVDQRYSLYSPVLMGSRIFTLKIIFGHDC